MLRIWIRKYHCGFALIDHLILKLPGHSGANGRKCSYYNCSYMALVVILVSLVANTRDRG